MTEESREARILLAAPDFDPNGELPVATLEEIKKHLRVDHDDEDPLIAATAIAVCQALDASGESALGRALRPQRWSLRLAWFPCNKIVLPFPPVTAINGVTYLDSAGAEVSLVQDTYFVLKNLNGRGRQWIEPAYGETWPAARGDAESVRVDFTCGYGMSDGSPTVDTLPKAIRQATLLMVGDLYENREDTLLVRGQVHVSKAAERLLAPFRVEIL